MAISDRNLSIGTQLYARYKGETYTCQLVETEAGPRYRLADGREFKSPSAAGSAVMGGNACNGWAFWTVGDGVTATGPVRSARAPRRATTSSVRAVPKPEKRGQRAQTRTPATDTESNETAMSTETVLIECGDCGEVFATQEEALVHMETAHSPAEQEPTA